MNCSVMQAACTNGVAWPVTAPAARRAEGAGKPQRSCPEAEQKVRARCREATGKTAAYQKVILGIRVAWPVPAPAGR